MMVETKLKSSFANQISKNIASGWLSIGLMVSVSIILTPLLLNSFGKEVYGIWLLIFNFLAYFYLTDFGITNAITRLYAKYNVDQNLDAAKLVSTAYITVFIIDVCLLIILLTFKDAVYSFLEIKEEFYRLFTVLFYVGIFELITQFILRVNIGIIKGSHRFDVAYRFEGLAAVLRLGSVFTLLYLNSFDVVLFAILYSGSKILSDSLSFAHITEQLKTFKFTFDKRSFVDLFDMGTSSLVISLAGVLLNSLPILLFGKVFGVEKVFLYSIPFAISIILTRIINAIYHGLSPKSAELKVFEDQKKILEISSFGVKFAVLLCFCFVSFFISFGQEIMHLWLGATVLGSHDFQVMYQILIALLGYVFLETSQKPNIFIYKSVGLHWVVTIETLCSVVVFLLFSLLTYEFAKEMVFALALLSVGVFKYFYYKFVGRKKIQTYSLPLMFTIATAVVLIFLFSINHFDNLMIKVLIFSTSSFTFIFLFIKNIFSAQEQETINSQFIRLGDKVSMIFKN